MRDLREVRMAKLRAGVDVLEGGREVKMNGVGGMEIAEGRAFIVGVVDGLRSVFEPPFPPFLARRALVYKKGERRIEKKRKKGAHLIFKLTGLLRKIGASKELSRKEREAEERENGIGGGDDYDDVDYDNDDVMDI